MPRRHRALPGERESQVALRDRVHAWWLAAVSGQVDQSHPLHGTDLSTRVEGDTLVITGTVASENDLHEIERETEHLIGHGVARIRNELRVKPQSSDQRGLLAQTLLATYATAEQGGFAAGYLEGHATLKPLLLRLLPADDPTRARALLHAVVPSVYWDDAETALTGEQALLLVMVDELDAFKARELLDEETRSLMVLVLPPEPMRTVEPARAAMREADAASKHDSTSGGEPGDAAQRGTRAAEAARHER